MIIFVPLSGIETKEKESEKGWIKKNEQRNKCMITTSFFGGLKLDLCKVINSRHWSVISCSFGKVSPWLKQHLLKFPWGGRSCDLLERTTQSFTSQDLYINLLHSNISMHLLHTVPYAFPKTLSRRICLTIKSFFSCWSCALFSWPSCAIQWWYCKEKLDANHSQGSKGSFSRLSLYFL